MKKQTYKLKLTAISPIHIGTGEDFEPTNYVIDNEKGEDRLYEFDEFKFFEALSDDKKKIFANKAAKEGYDSLHELHLFIKEHKEIAKSCSSNKDGFLVLPDVAEYYYEHVGKPVQIEGKNRNTKRVFNEFKISKTYLDPNTNMPILPGSSLKGSISTALIEALTRKKGSFKEASELFDVNNDKNLGKFFLISDANPKKQEMFIGYAVNKERFEKPDSSNLKTILQVVSKGSEFETTISLKPYIYDDSLTMEKLVEACHAHYNKNFESIFEEKEILQSLDQTFVNQYKDLTKKLNKKQFLIRVGKHSGARAVTVADERKIMVKFSTIKGNNTKKKIDKLYKKSSHENDVILKELFCEDRKLIGKELKKQEEAKFYINEPGKLVEKIRNLERFSIEGYLTEETTIWLWKDSKNQTHLPFGWLLCELID